MSDVLAELQHLLRERLPGADPLGPDTLLVEDLALDSIQQLDLVVALENHFEISLEPEEGAEIATIGDLVAWIDRCRNGEAPRG